MVITNFERQIVASGQNVITNGEWDTYYYVVGEGEFDCFMGSDISDVTVTFRAGQSFGELALMYQCRRTATILAKTDGVLYKLSRDDFTNVLQKSAKERLAKFEV